MQALADVHDTPARKESWAVGFGLGWSVQLDPSHASANVTSLIEVSL